MKPSNFDEADTLYQAGEEWGELPAARRVVPGNIISVWEPTTEERIAIAEGGQSGDRHHGPHTTADISERLQSVGAHQSMTIRARFCNEGGCKDSWHVGGNYGAEVCRNPEHHDPENEPKRKLKGPLMKLSLFRRHWDPRRNSIAFEDGHHLEVRNESGETVFTVQVDGDELVVTNVEMHYAGMTVQPISGNVVRIKVKQ